MSPYHAILRMLFVVAMVVLVIQTGQNAYQKWFERRYHRVGGYDSESNNEDLRNESLETLMKKHDQAAKHIEMFESHYPLAPLLVKDRDNAEPYKTERELSRAIDEKHEEEKRVFETRFFWLSGFMLLLIGLFCYRKINMWIGLSVIIAAFIQMIAYSGPIRFPDRDTDVLLLHKVVFSSLTIVLLIVTGFFFKGTLGVPPEEDTGS